MPSQRPTRSRAACAVSVSEPLASTRKAKNSAGSDEAGEGHLACRAHALEGRARVQRRRRREEPAQREQVGEEDEVAGERDRRANRTPSGTSSPASSAVASVMTGAARKTQVVVVLSTISLRISFTRS